MGESLRSSKVTCCANDVRGHTFEVHCPTDCQNLTCSLEEKLNLTIWGNAVPRLNFPGVGREPGLH